MRPPVGNQHLLESHVPGVLCPSGKNGEEESDNAHCLFSCSVKLGRAEALQVDMDYETAASQPRRQ